MGDEEPSHGKSSIPDASQFTPSPEGSRILPPSSEPPRSDQLLLIDDDIDSSNAKTVDETTLPEHDDTPIGVDQSSHNASEQHESRHHIFLTSVFIAVIIIFVAVIIIWVNVAGNHATHQKITDVVQQYFTALQQGDANTAVKLTSDTDTKLRSDPFVSNEIYSKTVDRPRNMRINSIQIIAKNVFDTEAQVDVTYLQGSKRISGALYLSEPKNDYYSNSGTWYIGMNNMMDLYVGTGAEQAPGYSLAGDQTVLVNGQSINLKDYYVFLAFPGTYNFSLPQVNKWMLQHSASATVFLGSASNDSSINSGHSYISLNYAPSQALVKTAQQKVEAWLQKCANSGSPIPDDITCPFSTWNFTYISSNTTWSIIRKPDLTIISPIYDSTDGYIFGVLDSVPGTIALRGTAQEKSGKVVNVSQTMNFHVRGNVKIVGNTVTFVPNIY